MTFAPPTAEALLDLVMAWQRGEVEREALIGALVRVPRDQGHVVHEVLRDLCQRVTCAEPLGPGAHPGAHLDASVWREELMGCRARAWEYPEIAGLLVGPQVVILVDSREGVILRDGAARCVPRSVAGSLMLLCQTVVMAQSAVDARELEALRSQRVNSTSTSLSEIEPVE